MLCLCACLCYCQGCMRGWQTLLTVQKIQHQQQPQQQRSPTMHTCHFFCRSVGMPGSTKTLRQRSRGKGDTFPLSSRCSMMETSVPAS